MRTIVLHYHLFKNAGTSVDHVLRHNFPDQWATQEFDGTGATNTAQVCAWIKNTPDARAFSSHTMLGPLPTLEDVRIIPLVMLRDPLDRIRSAYQFERKQTADTKGAALAKAHDLRGYVTTRLAISGDRQCRNFQTARLAAMIPDQTAELTRAMTAIVRIQKHGVIGLVDRFHAAMIDLSRRVTGISDTFEIPTIRANAAQHKHTPLPPDLVKMLLTHNSDDLALLDHIRRTQQAA